MRCTHSMCSASGMTAAQRGPLKTHIGLLKTLHIFLDGPLAHWCGGPSGFVLVCPMASTWLTYGAMYAMLWHSFGMSSGAILPPVGGRSRVSLKQILCFSTDPALYSTDTRRVNCPPQDQKQPTVTFFTTVNSKEAIGMAPLISSGFLHFPHHRHNERSVVTTWSQTVSL